MIFCIDASLYNGFMLWNIFIDNFLSKDCHILPISTGNRKVWYRCIQRWTQNLYHIKVYCERFKTMWGNSCSSMLTSTVEHTHTQQELRYTFVLCLRILFNNVTLSWNCSSFSFRYLIFDAKLLQFILIKNNHLNTSNFP